MSAVGKLFSELYRNDFNAFNHRAFLELNRGETLIPGWHLELLAAKLEEVRCGRCKRLLISVPPRHGKTHTTTIAFPAWLLAHNPSLKIALITYGQELSDEFAGRTRDLIISSFYKHVFQTRLASEREPVADFHTTEGGYQLSTSIGGVLTGRGADVVILDDALKADDAHSDARRTAVNKFFDNSVRSRLNNQETGAIIVVQQRLHVDDLPAHVQKHEKWDIISLPAIAEVNETHQFHTPLGMRTVRRKVGEALHPERLSLSTLETLRQTMTDYNFSAQFQQNPQPPSGNIVKRDWLHYYTPDEKPERFDMIVQSWDTAMTLSDTSGFSVCTTWGLKRGKMYLLSVFKKRLEFPALKKAIKELAALHKANLVLIENKVSGISLIQELRNESFSIVREAVKFSDGKEDRLRAQTTKIEGGFALFPKEAPWLDEYLRELLSFPNSPYSDMVDSTVHALAWLTEGKPQFKWTKEGLDALGRFSMGSPIHRHIMRNR